MLGLHNPHFRQSVRKLFDPPIDGNDDDKGASTMACRAVESRGVVDAGKLIFVVTTMMAMLFLLEWPQINNIFGHLNLIYLRLI